MPESNFGELIEDAVISLYDELVYTREMLDSRCDEMARSGVLTAKRPINA